MIGNLLKSVCEMFLRYFILLVMIKSNENTKELPLIQKTVRIYNLIIFKNKIRDYNVMDKKS